MLALNILLSICLGAYVGKLMALTVQFLPPILLEGCDKGREPSDILKWYFQKPFCWTCGNSLPPLVSLPVIGYLSIRGRCSSCQKPLPLKIILLELGTGLLFGVSTLFFTVDPALLFVLGVSCLLICCFVTDYEHGILPDQLTLTLVWLGLLGSLYPIFISPQEAILGAVSGYGILWGFNLLYCLIRKFDGMFPGDFKLNAGIGACVGFKLLIPVLILSMVFLIVTTFIKVFGSAKSTDTGHVYSDFLYKEVPYACYTSIIAMITLYLLLSQSIVLT